ncbi:MAG: hypothetical protein RQ723_08680 [Desulfuromonadales bacterium]|nr:hypothetical protein [Desulfuromonadales bacterium]
MKKLVLPLVVFVAGLAVAGYLFNIDIEALCRGAWQLARSILVGD